jgi:GAF domain-containing protein
MSDHYMERLHELAKETNTADDIQNIINIIVEHLSKILNVSYCSLFIKNPASEGLELKAHNHIEDSPFIHITKEQESVMNLALDRKSPLIINNIEKELGIPNKEKYKTKSFMNLPVMHRGEIKGVLNLADKRSGRFTKHDIIIASIVTEFLGILFGFIEPSIL